jgi:hypothetical protein
MIAAASQRQPGRQGTIHICTDVPEWQGNHHDVSMMSYMATITSPTGVAAEVSLDSNFRRGNALPDGHAPAQLGGRGLVRAAASTVVPLRYLRDSIRLS